MPIALASTGETVVIRAVLGDEKMRQHLSEMGLVVNSEVTVVSRNGGGLIVQVKDGRIAIDRSLANRILI